MRFLQHLGEFIELSVRFLCLRRTMTISFTPQGLRATERHGLLSHVLMVLWEQDNRVVSDITERLRLETNTVTPLLQRMEKMGLIVRTPSQVDSRQRIVQLTKEGRRMEERAKQIPQCLVSHLAEGGLQLDDLAQLAPLLDKLIAAV